MPSTTFCWLPPLKVRTGWLSLVLASSFTTARMRSTADFNDAPASQRNGVRPCFGSVTSVKLSPTEASRHSPSLRRFSVRKATPRSISSRGERRGNCSPFKRTSPAILGSSPKRMRASSERPAPINPDSPSTSPRRSVKETSLSTPGCDTPFTSRSGAPVPKSAWASPPPWR